MEFFGPDLRRNLHHMAHFLFIDSHKKKNNLNTPVVAEGYCSKPLFSMVTLDNLKEMEDEHMALQLQQKKFLNAREVV